MSTPFTPETDHLGNTLVRFKLSQDYPNSKAILHRGAENINNNSITAYVEDGMLVLCFEESDIHDPVKFPVYKPRVPSTTPAPVHSEKL